MKVIPIFCYNTLRNFSYLVFGEDYTVCIDPYDPDLILEKLNQENKNLDYILNTHGHHDHIKGNDKILKETQAKLISLKENQKLKLSKNEFLTAFNTPGHTMDHQCFIGIQDNGHQFVLSGDTLFNAGVGNCKNGGDKKLLYQTMIKILDHLIDDSVIYPGHDYFHNNLSFIKKIKGLNKVQNEYYEKEIKAEKGNFPFLTFKELKKINIFLNVNSLDEFLDLREQRDRW